MKHILSALAIVCMMIVEQAHAQGLQPKSFFPKEARTVDEVCAMMTTSNTEEMVLFRKMVIELLSSPALTDRNMNEREVINYLRQHLSVRPASQVIYSGARPINAREVVAIGRFPEDGEVAFCIDLGYGDKKVLFLGKDGTIVLNHFGKE